LFTTLLITIVIVMVFTSPWDSYAVSKGFWGFAQGQHVIRLGFLPIEEYLFFVLQTVEVFLLTHCAAFLLQFRSAHTPSITSLMVPLVFFAIAWIVLGLAVAGHLLPKHHYLFHLLYWFSPVLVFQWLLAGRLLWTNALTILLPAIFVGSWLSFGDMVAIQENIWFFDESQILGIKLKGIPVEEILFFCLTSLLIAQSYVMLLPIISQIEQNSFHL
ncbi:MAG: lycopene cyclase domain-containing protein, partial [Verrucomicrobia bacterium]|nr:lycopene cyclase domain-containing protein [Verrucomicrobiota bacterium]